MKKFLNIIVIIGVAILLVACHSIKETKDDYDKPENWNESGTSIQEEVKIIKLKNGILEREEFKIPFYNTYFYSLNENELLYITRKEIAEAIFEDEVNILKKKTNQIVKIGAWKEAVYASYVPQTDKAYVVVTQYDTAETSYLLEIDCKTNTTREILFSDEMKAKAKEKNLNEEYKSVQEVLVREDGTVIYKQNGSLYLSSLDFKESELLLESENYAKEGGKGYHAICFIGDKFLYQESYWEDSEIPALFDLKTKEINPIEAGMIGNVVVAFDEQNQFLYTMESYQSENLYQLNLITGEKKHNLSFQDFFAVEKMDNIEIVITSDFEKIYLSNGRTVMILDIEGNRIEKIEEAYQIREFGKEALLRNDEGEYYSYKIEKIKEESN